MYTLNWPPGITTKSFLQEYWQKKPLLIQQALPGFTSPISPAELAGLACEDNVEARLVLEKDGKQPWELRQGPFHERDFQSLPSSHWTLLVQDVEKHLPDLVTIMDLFQFIPYWRIDDLMVSYAPDQGSVGPHVDAYDVFLLQGMGTRHWHISDPDYCKTLMPNLDLRILEQFTSSQDWILQPGDVLYLPPGIPHYGVALNDCMTYSIGFRAPSMQGLVESFMEHVLENIRPEELYTDPDLDIQKNAHEITASSIHRIYQRVMQNIKLPDKKVSSWLGEILSESKPGFTATPPEPLLNKDDFMRYWESHDTLYRNTALRFLYVVEEDGMSIFIDSERNAVNKELASQAEWLCSTLEIDYSQTGNLLNKEIIIDILYSFYSKGYFYFDVE